MKGAIRAVRPLSSPRVLLLSGTPVSESPLNAYSVLKILDPDRIPGRTRFENHFIQKAAVQTGPVTINKPVGYTNLSELKTMIEAVSVRRLKCDIRGMPDRTEQTHVCQPTKEQAGHYAEILRGILADIEGDPEWAKTLDLAVVKLLRLRQVLSHPSILGLSGDSGKLLELDGLVEEVLSNPAAKVVIWATWNAEVDVVARRYAAYKPVTIDQRTTQEELAELEHTFDVSDQRIAIGTPQKAGTGVDWLARARTAIYIEKTYSLVSHRQSIDRIVRRVGDDNPGDSPAARRIKQIKRSGATIIYLHVPNSVDDVVSYVLNRKIELGDSLLTSDRKLLEDGKLHLLQMLRGGMKL